MFQHFPVFFRKHAKIITTCYKLLILCISHFLTGIYALDNLVQNTFVMLYGMFCFTPANRFTAYSAEVFRLVWIPDISATLPLPFFFSVFFSPASYMLLLIDLTAFCTAALVTSVVSLKHVTANLTFNHRRQSLRNNF